MPVAACSQPRCIVSCSNQVVSTIASTGHGQWLPVVVYYPWLDMMQVLIDVRGLVDVRKHISDREHSARGYPRRNSHLSNSAFRVSASVCLFVCELRFWKGIVRRCVLKAATPSLESIDVHQAVDGCSHKLVPIAPYDILKEITPERGRHHQVIGTQ